VLRRAVPPEISIDSRLRRLTMFQGHVCVTARRASLFAWFCWGFLCATVFGMILGACLGALYAVVTTSYTQLGSELPTPVPTWALVLGMIPAALFLVLAVLEVVKGRRESRHGAVRVRVARRGAPSRLRAGWIERAQRTQQLIANIRGDTDLGFIPLLLGGLLLASIFGLPLLLRIAPTYPPYFLEFGLLPIPVLVLLAAFFLTVRGWTRPYQRVFDHQVTALAHLVSPSGTRRDRPAATH
jgi:hypothetical protein